VVPEKPSRRIDPPRVNHRLRLVRSGETHHHLMTADQQKAVLALLNLPGGDQK
jgi:hypothetical protein